MNFRKTHDDHVDNDLSSDSSNSLRTLSILSRPRSTPKSYFLSQHHKTTTLVSRQRSLGPSAAQRSNVKEEKRVLFSLPNTP